MLAEWVTLRLRNVRDYVGTADQFVEKGHLEIAHPNVFDEACPPALDHGVPSLVDGNAHVKMRRGPGPSVILKRQECVSERTVRHR